jgi:hypothetical protein
MPILQNDTGLKKQIDIHFKTKKKIKQNIVNFKMKIGCSNLYFYMNSRRYLTLPFL